MTLSIKSNLPNGPSLQDIAHALNKIEKKDEFKRRSKEKDEKEKEKLGLRRRHPVKTIVDLS
jgi:hypothetical protein